MIDASFRSVRQISPPARGNTLGTSRSICSLGNRALSWLVLDSGGCQRFERITMEVPDREPVIGKLAGGSCGSGDLRPDNVQGPLVTTRSSHGTATFSGGLSTR